MSNVTFGSVRSSSFNANGGVLFTTSKMKRIMMSIEHYILRMNCIVLVLELSKCRRCGISWRPVAQRSRILSRLHGRPRSKLQSINELSQRIISCEHNIAVSLKYLVDRGRLCRRGSPTGRDAKEIVQKKGKEVVRSVFRDSNCNAQETVSIFVKLGRKMMTRRYVMGMKCIVDCPRLPRNPSLYPHTKGNADSRPQVPSAEADN